MRTLPVKYSAGPFPDGCEPTRRMSTVCPSGYALSEAMSITKRYFTSPFSRRS
jgi:hypothetical protein